MEQISSCVCFFPSIFLFLNPPFRLFAVLPVSLYTPLCGVSVWSACETYDSPDFARCPLLLQLPFTVFCSSDPSTWPYVYHTHPVRRLYVCHYLSMLTIINKKNVHKSPVHQCNTCALLCWSVSNCRFFWVDKLSVSCFSRFKLQLLSLMAMHFPYGCPNGSNQTVGICEIYSVHKGEPMLSWPLKALLNTRKDQWTSSIDHSSHEIKLINE